MNAAFYLRGQAAGYRLVGSGWRLVCEFTRAELCDLSALLLEIEADRLEYFEGAL